MKCCADADRAPCEDNQPLGWAAAIQDVPHLPEHRTVSYKYRLPQHLVTNRHALIAGTRRETSGEELKVQMQPTVFESWLPDC